MTHQISLSDPYGNRLALLETAMRFNYTRVFDGVGSFEIALPESFPSNLARLDGRVEIWRSPRENLPPQLQMVGFVRQPRCETDDNSLTTFVLDGFDLTYLLSGRIVAYAAATTQVRVGGPADDVMKAIVAQNLGSSAVGASVRRRHRLTRAGKPLRL